MKKSIIKQYENIALTDKHIFDLLKGQNNLVLYPNLINYRNIDEVLGPNGMCVLLFEAKKNYGHWCCLWKLNNNTVSFFNSYGGYPDDTLEYIPEHFAMMNNEDVPYLSMLLDESPYKLTYNETAYQKKGSDMRTCGRHCVVRLFNRNKTDKQYYKYVKGFCDRLDIDPDEFVTLMTMDPKKGR